MSGEQSPNKIVPLYAARVENLRPGSFVGVICDACGHSSHVPSETIQNKLPGSEPIKYLGVKLRCEACGERGRVILDVRRALGYV